jgi:hypothetical protein
LGFQNSAETILSLFDGKNIPTEREAEARGLLRNLKSDLEAEYKRMSSGKGQRTLSEMERLVYYPAICDAWTNCGFSSLRWDSRADARWYDPIWSVSDYMKYWRNGLKRNSATRL